MPSTFVPQGREPSCDGSILREGSSLPPQPELFAAAVAVVAAF